jgi:glycosyltransferase involved in cell wall biosynthesis
VQQAQTEIVALSSGWYLVEGAGFEPSLRMHLVVESATVQTPRERLPLRAVDAQGHLQSAVVLAHGARRAWLSPDDAGARPQSGSWAFRRVGRMEALIRMLSGLRTEAGAIAWKETWRALLDAVAIGSSAGASRAAGLVVGRYLFNLRAGEAQGDATADATFRPGAWPIAISVQLQPVKHLQPMADAPAPGSWEATGEDPCFRLVDHGMAVALKSGWYRLRVRIPLESGAIVAPALYPDYGQGYLHDEMIRLPDPGPDGEIDSLLLLKHDVRTLRFDPTLRRARFRMDRFDLARIGRVSALLRMLGGLRGNNGSGSWKGVASAAARFVRTAVGHDLSTAVSDLYAAQPSMQAQGGSYADWVRRYDTIGRLELEGLRQRARKLGDGPLVSVVLPVFQTPEAWLRRCLDSVLQQVYPNWELCVADDASPDPRVREILEEYARRDARIKLVFRAGNGHIAEASNSALQLATGEFIGLLDHDDELRPHALLEMAEAIACRNDLGLLYSDEDKIDAEGRRFSPYFKPDWNPDLLLSQNYVCHFTVIRADLVRAVGGFRKGFEGSQDHDLILRCSEMLDDSRIHHIPKVLYHWRAVEGSTALTRNAKDYASSAGARAVGEHLGRLYPGAGVEELLHGHYRVHWPLPNPLPKVSLVIPTRDKAELLRVCIESILERTTYPELEVVVVDNRSSEQAALAYLAELEQRAGVRVLRYDAPFNYSTINNWAVTQCDGSIIGLVNNDIEVISPGWLQEMVSQAMRPEVGAVGAMLYYPNDTIQHAGVVLGVHGIAAHLYAGMPRGYPGHGGRARVAQSLSAVTGACMVMRRVVYEQAGGLDESLQVAFNDIDFCLRLREAGYLNIWTPFAELYHHESASRGSEDTDDKKERFAREVNLMQQRWGGQLPFDPAYNVNLSLSSLCCELSNPPRAVIAAVH